MRSMMHMATAVAVLALGCGAAAGTGSPHGDETSGEFKTIEPKALWSKLQAAQQVFVIDNNRQETYDLGHVPGAVMLRPQEVTADKLPNDKAAMLVFYCANEH